MEEWSVLVERAGGSNVLGREGICSYGVALLEGVICICGEGGDMYWYGVNPLLKKGLYCCCGGCVLECRSLLVGTGRDMVCPVGGLHREGVTGIISYALWDGMYWRSVLRRSWMC